MRPDLLPRVEATIHRYAMLKRGDGVVVACSGGPDSLALLGILCELRAKFNLSLTAVYVNHCLRPEAAAEGEFVCQQAAAWGVQGLVRDVAYDLHTGAGSVQAEGRAERYRILHAVAGEVGAQRIALGHTADDQAETLVMRFIRGTGSQGLAGIPPVNGQVVRPLIDLWRADTEAYCAGKGLTPVRDASNDHDDYLRNRIRHHLMPVLQDYNPRVKANLLTLSAATRAENEWMDAIAESFLAAHVVATDGGWWCGAVLVEQPLALQQRVLRTLVRRSRAEDGFGAQELAYDHTMAVLALLSEGNTGTSMPLPGGLIVWKERGGFWLGPAQRVAPYSYELSVPGTVTVPGMQVIAFPAAGGLDALGEVQHGPSIDNGDNGSWQPGSRRVALDWQTVRGKLFVRSRLPGDRYQPMGMQGEKKLQDIFVDAGVPRRWRDRLPVVQDEAGIIWVLGFRPAERVKVTASTSMTLQIAVKSDTKPKVESSAAFGVTSTY